MTEPWVELRMRLGTSLSEHRDHIIDTMFAAIESADPMLQDPEAASLLRASIAGNVHEILDGLVKGAEVNSAPEVPAAVEYAIALAQRDVPAASLRRAYHIGSNDLLGHIFAEIQAMDANSDTRLKFLHHMAGWMHLYVDHITRTILDAYDAERRYWDDRDATAAAHEVHLMLSAGAVDVTNFEHATGHRVDQIHVGALLWVQGASPATDHLDLVTRMARTLAAHLGGIGTPLVTAIDRNSARVWFGRRTDDSAVSIDAARSVLAASPDVRLALGRPAHGAAGFRATMSQAEQVAVIPRLTTVERGRVVSHGDDAISLVARLADDPEGTRDWVRLVLGPLAENTAAAARHRKTILTFLQTGGSYVETAERLVMHRNSIKYRVEKAEEVLGRGLDTHRLDTQTALMVCDLLGSVVLAAES